MFKQTGKLGAIATAGTILVGCGGGSGGEMTRAGLPNGNLIGATAETTADISAITLKSVTGTNPDGAPLSIAFNGYDFVSENGLDDGDIVEAGGSGLLSVITLPADYQTKLVDGAYDANPNPFVSVFYGLLGPEPDGTITSTGTATFQGHGFAVLRTGGVTSNLGTGTANVTVDFTGPGNVDATLTGFSGDVDTIKLNGMTITGNRFGGGTIGLEKSGQTASPIGGSVSGDTSGLFAGSVSASGIPAEAAGLFYAAGDDGAITGGFIAK